MLRRRRAFFYALFDVADNRARKAAIKRTSWPKTLSEMLSCICAFNRRFGSMLGEALRVTASGGAPTSAKIGLGGGKAGMLKRKRCARSGQRRRQNRHHAERNVEGNYLCASLV